MCSWAGSSQPSWVSRACLCCVAARTLRAGLGLARGFGTWTWPCCCSGWLEAPQTNRCSSMTTSTSQRQPATGACDMAYALCVMTSMHTPTLARSPAARPPRPFELPLPTPQPVPLPPHTHTHHPRGAPTHLICPTACTYVRAKSGLRPLACSLASRWPTRPPRSSSGRNTDTAPARKSARGTGGQAGGHTRAQGGPGACVVQYMGQPPRRWVTPSLACWVGRSRRRHAVLSRPNMQRKGVSELLLLHPPHPHDF